MNMEEQITLIELGPRVLRNIIFGQLAVDEAWEQRGFILLGEALR